MIIADNKTPTSAKAYIILGLNAIQTISHAHQILIRIGFEFFVTFTFCKDIST